MAKGEAAQAEIWKQIEELHKALGLASHASTYDESIERSWDRKTNQTVLLVNCEEPVDRDTISKVLDTMGTRLNIGKSEYNLKGQAADSRSYDYQIICLIEQLKLVGALALSR